MYVRNLGCLVSGSGILFTINIVLFLPAAFVFGESKHESEISEKLYIKLFKQQRAEQLEAIKSFQKITNQDKKYTLLKLMAEKIFSVIQNSRAVIEASYFIPGVSDFPLHENTRDSLSNILENVALFSEITLRFPNFANSVLKSNNTWDILFQWGIAFTHQMKYILDNNTIKLLQLVSQELNHVEKDPNYVNPYRENSITKDEIIDHKKPTKRKKTIKKGPKLSHYHNEL
ncbi:unnamed protein product [Phaedon cochleariae]|uniref:Coiled-coil domain-containing protein 134 n=1 Tax=Phaedon cochleariae TaxID=80249 RepID=A0A9P0DTV7_PHACE|nr:unnamed protein product [Phaedon cochleariae]